MKKSKFCLKHNICVMLAFIMLAIFSCAHFNFNNTNYANAIDNESHVSGRMVSNTQTIFIHSPTHSIIYHQKLYFIDDYDKLLKVYDFEDEKISSNYISLELLGTIIDVAYVNENIFILSNLTSSETLQLTLINLPDFEIEKTIPVETSSNAYSKIDVCDIETDWIISLTPDISTQNPDEITSPIILTFNKTHLTITNYFEIVLDDLVKSKLFKLMTVESIASLTNDLYLVIVYDNQICFFGCQLSTITSTSSLSVDPNNSSSKTRVCEDSPLRTLLDVNKIYINNKNLFVNSYKFNSSDDVAISHEFSYVYEYVYENVSDDQKPTEYNPVTSFHHDGSDNYFMISNGYVVYPIASKQQITFAKLTYNTENTTYTSNTNESPIDNPSISINYKSEADFEYVTANKKTRLLEFPWEPADTIESDDIIIDPTESPKDLIVIGDGKIDGENSIIEGYKYCVFTTVDKNLKGYVKTEDLTPKDTIEVDKYDYKVFKVQPNTILYSLPTTILHDNLTPSLSSSVVATIKENSRVELVDAICKYTSNEKIMLKVKVNGTEVGYIEYDKIIKPSEKVSFVITNASIKSNNTKIYLNSNPDSPIIYTLDEGYRIRINGARNTDSGYTSITFNDEYGNEFSGYILTDSIGSDSWTVMQIIGCVLIAINIGLLILILRFKRNSIGVNGSKYIDSEK